MLFSTPTITTAELRVIDRISKIRDATRYMVSSPLRWYGLLRRSLLARAIRGSNSIEGYYVSKEDAIAAVEGAEPSDPNQEAWKAVVAYRDAMTYVLQLTKNPTFHHSEDYLRSLHFIMLGHDLAKNPGNWRPGPVSVRDDQKREVVYDAPDRELVEPLMNELVTQLNEVTQTPHIIKAAMAHLNLVMIHPFSDGNGRMARCLQTLVLSQEGILEPSFCSIEEYLGRFTQDYYDVLAAVGKGKWNPHNDALPWIRFMLKAHFQQGQLLAWRMKLYGRLWEEIQIETQNKRLPERVIEPIWDAAIGHRVRNAMYRKSADVSENLASRDFKALVQQGLLTPHGVNRGRYYQASQKLLEIRSRVYESFQPEDPFAESRESHLTGVQT
jgi:Fic family protein